MSSKKLSKVDIKRAFKESSCEEKNSLAEGRSLVTATYENIRKVIATNNAGSATNISLEAKPINNIDKAYTVYKRLGPLDIHKKLKH
jgi:hypothetical protein